MNACPDCGRSTEGVTRCRCGALVGTVARSEPSSKADIPYRAHADITSYRRFLADPFPEPSRKSAHDLLERAAAGEHLLLCQIQAASVAVATEYKAPKRERQPGED